MVSKFSQNASSTASSIRAARLQTHMKLVEKEQVLKEQELYAEEMMRKNWRKKIANLRKERRFWRQKKICDIKNFARKKKRRQSHQSNSQPN